LPYRAKKNDFAQKGYKASQIIGRNCRFLQGKSTSPAAVKAIKEAVDTGSDITQLVLNYTAEVSLEPFEFRLVENIAYFQSDRPTRRHDLSWYSFFFFTLTSRVVLIVP